MFKELLNEKNWSRIRVDDELKEPLKNVFLKMESYFQEKGYEDIRDYKKFFEEHLLKSPEGKEGNEKRPGFPIKISDEPSKIGADGFFRHRGKNGIHIDESVVKRYPKEEIEITLTHEFIHFFVMFLLKKDNADLNIYNGGFINEALTEMLAREVVPNSRSSSYEPQVSMLKFANELTGNKNNYKKFLQGRIDFKINGAPYIWNDFIKSANEYQKEFRDKGFLMRDAQNSSSYINAQRNLIEYANYSKMEVNGEYEVEDYLKTYKKVISDSPVQDSRWKEEYYEELDKEYVRKERGLSNEDLTKVSNKLKETRQLVREKEKEKINEFTVNVAGNNIRIKINEDLIDIDTGKSGFENIDRIKGTYGSVYINGFKIGCKEGKLIATNIKSKLEETVDIEQEYEKYRNSFEQKQAEIQIKLDENLKILDNKDLKKDLNILNCDYDYTRIDKIKIPGLNYEEKDTNTYVLYLQDGNKIILNSSGQEMTAIEQFENKQLQELKGKVGTKEGFMYDMEENGTAQEGYIFSDLSEKQINNLSTNSRYENIPEDKIRNQVIDSRRKYLVYENNNEIEMATEDDTFSFVGKKETIFDENDKGVYNSIIEKTHEEKNIEKTDESRILNVDKYTKKEETTYDMSDLMRMIYGLDQGKRIEAIKFIEQLTKEQTQERGENNGEDRGV